MLLSKLITIAIPYAFKWVTDALAGKLSRDAFPLSQVLVSAAALTIIYGVLRVLMSLTQQGRDALFAAVAMNAVRRLANRSLRTSASSLVALSSGAQDRRTDAGSRARPQRYRNDHSHFDVDGRSDDRRVRTDRRRSALLFRLALCGGGQRDRRRLFGLYDHRHQLAHRHSPLDERKRHRRQHQGDRQPAQFRDSQVFRCGRARSGALRQGDGALRAHERAHLCVPGRAQCGPGGDFHARPHRRAGDVRGRDRGTARRPSAISCSST